MFEHFEKRYFHELEIKEKMSSRVQISFALLISSFTIMSYMVRTIDYNIAIYWLLIVFGLLSVYLIFTAISSYFLITAFWGNIYKIIPSPLETDNFRNDLIKHKEAIEKYNSDYPNAQQPEIDVDAQITDFLYDRYRDCAADNQKTNDIRSERIHLGFKWFLYSLPPLLISGALFTTMDFDVSSKRKTKDPPPKALTVINEFQIDTPITFDEKITTNRKSTMSEEKSGEEQAPPPPASPSAPESSSQYNREDSKDKEG